MTVPGINIRVDSEVKAQAQHIFALSGLDMSADVNIFCGRLSASAAYLLSGMAGYILSLIIWFFVSAQYRQEFKSKRDFSSLGTLMWKD
jgi:hypothetical protein